MDESQEKALADVLPAAKAASEIIRGVMRHRHFLAWLCPTPDGGRHVPLQDQVIGEQRVQERHRRRIAGDEGTGESGQAEAGEEVSGHESAFLDR